MVFDGSNEKNRGISDSETLDEGFESPTNVNEIARSIVQQELNSTDQQNYEFSAYNNKKPLNTIKSTQRSTDQQKNKRSSTIKHPRPTSINNNLNRNIQRCAVSRRLSAEKNAEETRTISSTSIAQSQMSTVNRRTSSVKPKNTVRTVPSATVTSSFARPLRAFQMSTLITNESPKTIRKTPSTPHHHHHLTVQKPFASRTVLTTVLPSSNLITNHKTAEFRKTVSLDK